MSTITREFTKEQLQQIIETDHVQCGEASSLARIALASLEAEAVAYMYKDNLHADARFSLHTRFGNWSQEDINEYEITEIPLYTAPPAPVSVPDAMTPKQASRAYCGEVRGYRDGWNACRAAMLQGAGPVSQRDELPLDYLQGHKNGLEWAAQLAEANHPQTADWLYDDPLELAKAIRKGPDMPEASGNSPVIPDGWMLVPIEPTTNQWAAGMQAFDSGMDKVTRVYKAMLAAAPQQEVK